MKYKKFIKITIILLICLKFNTLDAKEAIVYIDMNNIMSNSLVGKAFSSKLLTYKKKNSEKLNKVFKGLKSDEKTLIAQKNVLEKSEFKKKYDALQLRYKEYSESIQKLQRDINNKSIKSQAFILEKLTPILSEYAKDNSINLILNKKNVIIGRSNLDITQNIMKSLNNKIKDIKLKN
mgnify:FL=1